MASLRFPGPSAPSWLIDAVLAIRRTYFIATGPMLFQQLDALQLFDVPLGLSRLGGHQVPNSQEGTEQSRIRRVTSKVRSIQEALDGLGQEGPRDSVPGYQATRKAMSGQECAKQRGGRLTSRRVQSSLSVI